jgi:hypothetical protein
VLQKAADQRDKHIRSVQKYFEVRRDGVGARLAFVLIELNMNLPDEAVHHPVVEEMAMLAVDMIILDNVGCASFRRFLRLIGRPLVVGYRFIQRGAGTR